MPSVETGWPSMLGSNFAMSTPLIIVTAFLENRFLIESELQITISGKNLNTNMI